jgi:6-phosphogluconolactonase
VSSERVVASPAELARVFVSRVETSARAARRLGRRLSLVLPGGSVAEAFLPALAAAELDWAGVELFWGDERAVPPDHPQSNFRLADELLVKPVGMAPVRVHRMPADWPNLDEAARAYETNIARTLGDTVRFDVVLLGVGPDGHVCSLFPGHPAVEVTTRRVVAVADSPKPPPARLTLTLPALRGADIVVAAFGESKAEAIADALDRPASPLPVARAAAGGRRAIFLLDPGAASRLPRRFG